MSFRNMSFGGKKRLPPPPPKPMVPITLKIPASDHRPKTEAVRLVLALASVLPREPKLRYDAKRRARLPRHWLEKINESETFCYLVGPPKDPVAATWVSLTDRGQLTACVHLAHPRSGAPMADALSVLHWAGYPTPRTTYLSDEDGDKLRAWLDENLGWTEK